MSVAEWIAQRLMAFALEKVMAAMGSLLTLGNSDTNWPTRWQAQIELTPGTHTLTATAVHPSKLFTNSTSTTFTNAAVDQTTLSYFSEGQLTSRVWKNSSGVTNRVQTFQWDAKGRLYRFTERDANKDGHDWTAAYDSLGRRWQTKTVPTTNDVPITAQTKTIIQAYDPAAEFLEVGVYVDGRWSWKVHGPDMNGVYGGMNGLGGWDAVVTGPDKFYPLVQDIRGNILGAGDPDNGGMSWNGSRTAGYGSVAGRRPLSLGEGASLWEAGSWRGKYPELSGLYNLGARYYDPVAGRFLSPDPMGHDSDPSLYAAFNGDPVNYFDPDGRFGKNAVIGAVKGDFAGDTGWGGIAGQTAAGLIPIYGQIADIRDTAAAVYNMRDGGWQDGMKWAGLGLAVVAWVPGLDFVKGGDNVAHQMDNVVREVDNAIVHHIDDIPVHIPDVPPNLGKDLPYESRQMRNELEAKYGAENVTSTTVPPSNARNADLAGDVHPVTGVPFDNRGFPIFDNIAAFDTKLPSQSFANATYEQQMKMASQDLWGAIQRGEVSAGQFTPKQLGQIENGAAKIDNFTWHHHQDSGRMQLVPSRDHSMTGHVGGAAMSGGL